MLMKLLIGEMPEGIEEVFGAAGTSLFPAAGADLEMNCSCPDWANPCKHVAAVHLLLGERFDADPFLIFELRGRTQQEIAAMLRARRARGQAEEAPVPAALPEQESVTPLDTFIEGFWSAPVGLDDLALAFQAPSVDAVPVKRLGRPAFWRHRRDFTALMEETYRAIGARALRLAMGDGERS